MNDNLVRYSKFISMVLRHKPQLIGLVMDEGGWVEVDALLNGMNARGMPVDRAVLERVVAENDKHRFIFNADRTKIRANQGHSIAVDLGLSPRTPPELLYHGTAVQNLGSIQKQGLVKGKRQAVHLSSDRMTAEKVGRRHGKPAVLLIEAGRMAAEGFLFTCSENGVWLVDHVPPEYIQTQNAPLQSTLGKGKTVRDALESDVPALAAIKGAGSEVIHRDRLRDAREAGFRYLVILADQEVIGFACLVFRRPAGWSDAADTQHLPQIVDLEVLQARRGQGYGSALIHAMERIAAEAGHRQLFLAVEPHDNPHAFALYLRLGYRPLQAQPYHSTWGFIDSEGKDHHGEMWIVDMVKEL